MLSTGGMLDYARRARGPRRHGDHGHRDRDAAPAAHGGARRRLHRRQRARVVPLHEDDHAAQAARRPARRRASRCGCPRRSPSARACRSSAWSPSVSRAWLPRTRSPARRWTAPDRTGATRRGWPRGWPIPPRAWWWPARRACSSPASGRGCSRSTSCRDGLELVLLGVDGDGRAVFAADPGDELAGERRGLRDLAPVLSQAEGGLLAHAVALLNWHRRHRFCANCGAPSEAREAGHVRACPACGAQHHPRTDPVVIMLVTDGDRALLGRQAHWPRGPLLRAGGLRRAGREPRGGRRARGARGGRRAGRRRALPLVAAVAVPGLADARLRRALGAAASPPSATASSRTCAGSRARRSRAASVRPAAAPGHRPAPHRGLARSRGAGHRRRARGRPARLTGVSRRPSPTSPSPTRVRARARRPTRDPEPDDPEPDDSEPSPEFDGWGSVVTTGPGAVAVGATGAG